MNDYRSALDRDEDLQRAKEGIQRAQKLQKQAKKRDYYKILGVRRSASKKEINKVWKIMFIDKFAHHNSGWIFFFVRKNICKMQ